MRAALAYEWARITTIRSTYWLIGLTGFFFCGLSALLAIGLDASSYDDLPPGEVWSYLTTTVITGGGSVFFVPVLSAAFCGVLGTMSFGHEYRHGTIKQTLCAVPDRYAVFAAKALVLAVWILALSVVIMALNLASAALFMGRFSFTSLSIRPMIDFALYNLAFGWVGMALAMILRSLAGALIAILTWPFAIEPILFNILRAVTKLGNLSKLANFLPASAARRTMFSPYEFFANGIGQSGNDTLGGFNVWGLIPSTIVMWCGVLITLCTGLALFVRRDA